LLLEAHKAVTLHTFHVNIDLAHQRLKQRTRAAAARARVVDSAGVVAGWLVSPTPEARWAASRTLGVRVHPLYVERTWHHGTRS
jgi:L-amino acid N-acyltransferase YncA